VCSAAENREKITKIFYCEGTKLFKVIGVNTP